MFGTAISSGQRTLVTAEQDHALAEVRGYAIQYAQSLPDYVCLQVTSREHDAIQVVFAESKLPLPEEAHRRHSDVIEGELTFAGHQQSYKVLKINGAPAPNDVNHDQLGSTISAATFSSTLEHIFGPASGTALLRWHGSGKLHGQAVVVFDFEIPQSQGLQLRDYSVAHDVVLGYKGQVSANAESKAVIRLDVHAVGFPRDSAFVGVDFTLDL